MSTGFAGAETGGVKIGDTVAGFAQGPIGLCATAGAKLMGVALARGSMNPETRRGPFASATVHETSLVVETRRTLVHAEHDVDVRSSL